MIFLLIALDQGFLTGGTCTPWGYEASKQGYEIRRQNNGYFKLFAKNLFSMLFEIRKHFPNPFLTSAFLNDFFVIRKSYCDVIYSFLFVPAELVLNWFCCEQYCG